LAVKMHHLHFGAQRYCFFINVPRKMSKNIICPIKIL
jgi:hypothetical protein